MKIRFTALMLMVTSALATTAVSLAQHCPYAFGNPEFAGVRRPRSIVTPDLNGDGHLDLVIAHSWGDLVRVFLNRGDGSFHPHIHYDLGGNPRHVAAGDIDGDGDVDIIVVHYTGMVDVLRNDGEGNFTREGAWISGSGPVDAHLVDVNGDGMLDVVSGGGSELWILLNEGGGIFDDGHSYYIGPDAQDMSDIAVIDLDHDGRLDIITAHETTANLALFRNVDGDSFDISLIDGVGAAPVAVAAADLNGDGTVDLAVVSSDDARVTLLLSAAGGLSSATTTFVVGVSPREIEIADFDADGDLDLAFPDGQLDQTLLYLNDGDASFSRGDTINGGDECIEAVAADVNSDGWEDLYIINGAGETVSLIFNRGGGWFADDEVYAVGSEPRTVAVGDLDDDGIKDLVVVNERTLSVLAGWTGGFVAEVSYEPDHGDASLESVLVAELNGDDAPDVVAGSAGLHVHVFLNDGNGDLLVATSYEAGVARAIEAGDVDGDGDVDLVAADRDTIARLLNNGDGTFGEPTFRFLNGDLIAMEMADVDLDGDPDLVIACVGTDETYDLLVETNDGAGEFTIAGTYDIGAVPIDLVVEDLHDRGAPDVVVLNASESLRVFNNWKGTGVLWPVFDYPAVSDPRVIATCDPDADGDLDLAVISAEEASVSLLLNEDEEFRLAGAYGVGAGPAGLTALDLDVSGTTDLVVTNADEGTISVLRGLCAGVTDPADLDGDGVVGLSDLLLLLDAWGPCPSPPLDCPPDLDGSGGVGLGDLLLLLDSWP